MEDGSSPAGRSAGWQSAKSLGLVQPQGFPGLPSDWISEWETFPSADGQVQLFSLLHHKQEWKDPCVLIVFHGIGEHGGRYLHFPHFLQRKFNAIVTVDHRGHGRSEGDRGYVASFDEYAEDAALFIRRVEEFLKSKFGAAELHVFGHSMGGLITLQMALRHPSLPLRSVNISAPALGLAAKVPTSKRLAGQIARWVYPRLQLDSGLDVSGLSRDPEVVRAYQEDRLVHSKVTPGLFFGMLDAMKEVLKSESGFEVPLQFLIPENDRLTDSKASLDFFERLKLRHKRLRTYPDFCHEICNELGKEQVFEDLIEWASLNKG